MDISCFVLFKWYLVYMYIPDGVSRHSLSFGVGSASRRRYIFTWYIGPTQVSFSNILREILYRHALEYLTRVRCENIEAFQWAGCYRGLVAAETLKIAVFERIKKNVNMQTFLAVYVHVVCTYTQPTSTIYHHANFWARFDPFQERKQGNRTRAFLYYTNSVI